MQTASKKILVLGLAFTFIIGFSALALAHGWRGHGPMMGYGGDQAGPGCYLGHGMGYGGSMGWAANLSEEQAAEVQRLRREFFDDSESLRRKIVEKRTSFASEMAKENPDRNKLSRLQKELSDLESSFDQLRLDFQLKIKKIVPNAVTPGAGYGPRHGYGHAGGMGPGYCWQ